MVKVLFIAGAGRSGSTILHNVLGQMENFAACGELRYIWGRSALKNQLCGCGSRFRDCGFWQAVMAGAFGGLEEPRARALLEYTASFRLRNLPLTWVARSRRGELARLGPYLDDLGRLYASIQAVAGSRVIVDSSKNPSYGYLLEQLDGIEPYYLHFVRDAPPVVHSWGKAKDFEPGVPMARKTPVESSLQWVARNLAAEMFLPGDASRKRRLRYEDFVERPRDHVMDIVEWLGERPDGFPFVSRNEVRLTRASHSVFGNSVRFRTGSVTLRPQDGWRDEMTRPDRLKVQGITWPVRRRYGYRSTGATTSRQPGPSLAEGRA